jgi:hypothetical protein
LAGHRESITPFSKPTIPVKSFLPEREFDPVKHATAGAQSLGMTFFKNQSNYAAIVLNNIEWHHAVRPHKTPQLNCGKIAVPLVFAGGNLDAQQRMRAIQTRRFLYSEEIFCGFVRLFDLMVARKAN